MPGREKPGQAFKSMDIMLYCWRIRIHSSGPSLLKYQYRLDGGKKQTHSEQFENCLDLLIGDRPTASSKLLPIALQRVTPLLLGGSNKDYKKVFSMVYILRGGIMETTAFKVGRYLSVADWLHRVYCQEVRDG